MSGFNGISNRFDPSLLGQLSTLRFQLNQLVVDGCMTIPVRVRLHLALDHIDDAILKEQAWQQQQTPTIAPTREPARGIDGDDD
jgi:hypothetical protein